MKWLWLVPVLLLASCQTTHPPSAEPSAPEAASAAGGTPLPAAPPRAKTGCETDAECPAGQVCGKCGEVGTCMGGCRSDADCGRDEACQQVQCIRCPCPNQCETKVIR